MKRDTKPSGMRPAMAPAARSILARPFELGGVAVPATLGPLLVDTFPVLVDTFPITFA